MDETLDFLKGILKHIAETGDVSAKAMYEWHMCEEKISKIGDYIAHNQKNITQVQQICEFLKSMNNLFDEFIKDLD
jgi:hypothetical protein